VCLPIIVHIMSSLKHEVVSLRDDTQATIFYIENKEQLSAVPEGILAQVKDLFNFVIEQGQEYPYYEGCKTLDDIKNTWMAYSTVIMVDGAQESLSDDQKLLGTYYVKPNYIGRCSHNCNAGFLVPTHSRGKGIGKVLGQSYLRFAPTLGYTYSVFNLVFETNVASLRIWDSLGFDRIGRIPNAGRLKGIDHPVTAIMFGKSLV